MRKYLFVVVTLIVGISIGFLVQPLLSGDNIMNNIKKFSDALNLTYKNYVEEVDTHQLVEAAIKGMLNELDVHSVYISAEEMKRVSEDLQGSFDGIGVEFDVINDSITVIAPIAGGPSEALGVLSGDKIVKIDGINVVGIERSEVPKKLKGPKGTTVEIDIHRIGESNLLHFAIKRDKIPLYTVDASYIIDGTDIGVVEINRFAQTTTDEMLEALRNLQKQGMKKLILDLRGNPGGYLNQAYSVADEFISKGDTVVFTKGRVMGADEVYIAKGGDPFEKIPLIVLVNAGSASASEIVTGSIQDLDRGLVVGETTYGKGLVQRQYPLDDGSSFRLTIAKYYTPSGRCIQRPYKDKDKYRHLAGRLELEEGSYVEDGYSKIKEQVIKLNQTAKGKDSISLDSLPLYKTKGGRLVFGGGGITPDYIIKSDTITNLSVEFRRKNLFNEFTDAYMQREGKIVRQKYENSFSEFIKNYSVNEDMLSEFKKLAESKGIKWDDSQYKIDKDYLKIAIKATISRIIWDRSKMIQIYSNIDKQFQKAIELFPMAERLNNKKR